MITATAAASLRLVLAAAVLSALAAVLVAGGANGAPRAGSAYLAPAGACAGADDPAAAPAVQQRAVACLVNWARVRGNVRRLAQPAALRRAAVIKGRGVASCKQFSHTPCGAAATAGLRAAGYRFTSFGENLFVGSAGHTSARAVVAAWLQSPGHRANILKPGFRHIGAGLVRADNLLGSGPAVVWIAEFASPR